MNSLVLSLAPKFVKLQTLMLKVLNPCGRVNAVSDYTLEAIGNNCNQMQSLNLGWCEKISDDGIMSLAYGCPDLRTLDLCGCVLITDESVVALADWCVHLRSLGLYYCRNITDRAMYSLAQSGLKNKPGQWQSSEAEKSQQCTCAHTFSSCSSGLRYVSSSSHVFRLS